MYNPSGEDNRRQLEEYKDESRWTIVKKSLQGFVFRTYSETYGTTAIVKKACADLVRAGISWQGTRVQENFIQERDILRYLNSLRGAPEGIVKLLDSWDDRHANNGQGVYYYLQEYISGGDLFELTSGFWSQYPEAYRPLPDGRRQPVLIGWHEHVIDIFSQLIEAVCWMHSKGIIHLDISLENVMIQPIPRDPTRPLSSDNLRYSVRIIDFGTAQNRPDGNFACTNFGVGKSAYMAIEVQNFRRTYRRFDGRAADMWSCGVVLFQMLVGSQLYQRATLQDATLKYAFQNGIDGLLQAWGRIETLPASALDLLQRIFRYEQVPREAPDYIPRITPAQAFRHSFVRLGEKELPRPIWDEMAVRASSHEEVDMDDTEMEEHEFSSSLRADSAVRPQGSDGQEPNVNLLDFQFRQLSVTSSETPRLVEAMEKYGFREQDMLSLFAAIERRSRNEFVRAMEMYGTMSREDCGIIFDMMADGRNQILGDDVLRFCVRDPRSENTIEGQKLLFETFRTINATMSSREQSDAVMDDVAHGRSYGDDEDDRF